MITPDSFKTRFPEFAGVADPRIQLFIDDAVLILNESHWGTKYDLGLSYYTAHVLALGTQTENGNAGAEGPVASQAVDGVSIAFAQPALNDQTDAYYGSTSYGQRYITLRKSLGSGATVV